MNKAYVYCVLDTKSRVYNLLNFLINDAVALRQFQLRCTDKENMMSRYPEDYRLYRVAEFDMLTGIMVPEVAPLEIAHGLQFSKPEVTE